MEIIIFIIKLIYLILKILQNCLNEISKDHKDISVIVNNAGVTEDNLIFRMKDDQWNKVIQTNLKFKLSNY